MQHRTFTHTEHDGQQATVLLPDWPLPETRVRAVFTTRLGGSSQGPWSGWNLGDHVGDDAASVAANRALLARLLGTGGGPLCFIRQVHGTHSLYLGADAGIHAASSPQADGTVTDQPGQVCIAAAADCLTILFAHTSLPVVAAAHAGWRGLAGAGGTGILERCFAHYASRVQMTAAAQGLPAPESAAVAGQTCVWLGPCIGPEAFEVGPDVVQAFSGDFAHLPPSAPGKCIAGQPGRWLLNLPQLARLRLLRLGLHETSIHGNDGARKWCTFSNPEWFFSHRRDSRRLGTTGRMAACIWLPA